MAARPYLATEPFPEREYNEPIKILLAVNGNRTSDRDEPPHVFIHRALWENAWPSLLATVYSWTKWSYVW